MVVDQQVTGGAVRTLLTSSMTPSVPGTGQTFTVDDATGYPPTGEMTVVIDRGESVEEKVLATRSGITFTVVSRGYDGSSGSSHTASESFVELALSATAVQQVFNHVDGVESNPHSGVLLDEADHDIEARHQFGSGLAFGVPVTPTALTPDIAGTPGVGNNPAREDHVHNTPAATAVTSGLANAEGSAATFARSDHTHDQAALSITSAELAALAVIAGKIADGGVDRAAALADGIITPEKVAFGAPTAYVPIFGGIVTPTGPYGHYYRFGQLIVGFAGCSIGAGGVTADITVSLPFANGGGFDGLLAARGRATGGNSGSGMGIIVNGESVGKNIVSIGSAEWGLNIPFGWTLNATLRTVFLYVAAP